MKRYVAEAPPLARRSARKLSVSPGSTPATHPFGNRFMHWVRRAEWTSALSRDWGCADDAARSRRVHGLPRGHRWPASGPAFGSRSAAARYCCVRSSSAACTISTAGTQRNWWPMHSSRWRRGTCRRLRGLATRSWHLAATGSCLSPESEYAMTWNIGDHGFEMTLSTRVPGLIAAQLRPWLAAWLAQHGLTPLLKSGRGPCIRAARAS